jgi:hypothetical protein
MALYGAVDGNRNERSGGVELNALALAGVNAGAGGTVVRDRLRPRVPNAALHIPRLRTPNRFGSLPLSRDRHQGSNLGPADYQLVLLLARVKCSTILSCSRIPVITHPA